MTIFVSIAAYRDPEVAPTLLHCIQQARYPADLRFGICWQHAPEEARPAEFDDRRVRVLDVLWHQSRGACWARAEIMKLWDGEDFYLQLDSHHRFALGWDAKLLAHAALTGAPKPVLSTYAAAFNPREPLPDPGNPTQMDFSRFSSDGIPLFVPRVIPHWPELRRPVRARFVSGHFLFAPGSIVQEVPYDPELYFIGEEITLAVRAYTHGYDLFHSHEHVLWHEYTRTYRTKHWDDHATSDHVDVAWHERDVVSKRKIRQLLHEPFIGRFGYGTARTFADYEAYAGLSFRHHAAQDATLRGQEPPNPPASPDWATDIRDWHVRIELDRAAMPPAALAGPRFWYVGAHDPEHREIHRKDAGGEELRRLVSGDHPKIVIERRFRSARQPATWTVWPVSAAGEWLAKTVGHVTNPTPTANP